MFIEIKNLYKAKRFLYKIYSENYKLCDRNQKKYLKKKIKHSNSCLKVLKQMKGKQYLEYASSILLHDIGRFFEYKKIENFEHAEYGYKYLKDNYTKDLLILLPIKYHEKNLDWLDELHTDAEFIASDDKLKQQIIEYSNLVREIDVISNMESILKNTSKIKNELINITLVDNLEQGLLCSEEQIKNSCDEIVYILCGLSMIMTNDSLKYLTKKQIVKKLTKRLFDKVNTEQQFDVLVKISKIIKEKYNM